MIITDFDGTLFSSEGTIPPENYEALESAGKAGFIRTIATGRSLFSFRRIMESRQLPLSDYIDYVIFSSGTGILELKSGSVIETAELSPSDASAASVLLMKQGIDFMIQKPLPDNHHMIYVKSNGSVNPDFYRRRLIYRDFAVQLVPSDDESELEALERTCSAGASQLVAIIPPFAGADPEKYAVELLDFLRRQLPGLSIIRTTSPIDHQSLWLEIFNSAVSKSLASERLASRFGLAADRCLAIGNDFNDEDLLKWAGTARTVDEAPERLRVIAPTAGPSAAAAVARACIEFLKTGI